MLARRIQGKGILAKFLEEGIRVLLIKECKNISNLKIDIISSSTQIIKGEIQTINIVADDVNYKNLLFDKFELKANQLKIRFKITNKKIYFENNPMIKFRICLSEKSLRAVLLSNDWNWIGNMISKEILNQEKFDNTRISNNELLMKTSEKNKNINHYEQINIKVEKGRVYLENKTYNKIIQIPIEDKIYVEDVSIENNLINILANSSIIL